MKLGHKEPIVEEDFKLLSAQEHAVWNERHLSPKVGKSSREK